MGFLRQEYWSGFLFHSPGDLPNPGIKPESPMASALQVESLALSHPGDYGNYYLCIWPFIYVVSLFLKTSLEEVEIISVLLILKLRFWEGTSMLLNTLIKTTQPINS